MAAPPHIAMFTTTGKGHLFPLLELARKLLTLHNCTITVIIPDDGSPARPQKDLLQTLPGINAIFLPPVSLNDVAVDAPIEIPIALSVTRSIPALCETLTNLSPISVFVTEHFGLFALESVKRLGIPPYVFFPGSAMSLCFGFHIPELHRSWNREYRDLPEPLRLPGCVPLHGSDFVSPLQNRNGPAYELCMEICRKVRLVEGILAGSFLDLEPETFKALQQDEATSNPPIYPIGPLVRSGSGLDSPYAEDCLKWLDQQPVGSVLYVSFGSAGTLNSDQLNELGLGLEMSGQRFLMVVRPPNDVVTAAYFTDGDDTIKPIDYFPEDFVERISGKGFLVPYWAPQIYVLKHPAVGGFLTHGGWNSIMESILHGGVPLIVWPLFAEQRMNAVFVSEGLKVAMRVTEAENGVVDREQISSMVRSLIEGEEGVELRKRMMVLKEAASRAFEENGSSIKTLNNLVEKWK